MHFKVGLSRLLVYLYYSQMMILSPYIISNDHLLNMIVINNYSDLLPLRMAKGSQFGQTYYPHPLCMQKADK